MSISDPDVAPPERTADGGRRTAPQTDVPSAAPWWTSRRWAYALLGLSLAGTLARWPAGNADTAAILGIAGRLLDGLRLYTDFPEPNPPLVFWLACVPEALARATGVSAMTLANALIAAVVAGSFALLAATLDRVDLPRDRTARALVLLAWIPLVVVKPGGLYGEREHLLFVCALPYVVAAAGASAGRAVPRGLALAVGALAGTVIALKPFFLGLWALPELVVLVRTRRPSAVFRPETLVVGGINVLYWAGVVLGTRYFQDLLGLWMPSYGAYDVPPLELVGNLSALWTMLPLWVAVALRMRLPDRAGSRPLEDALLAAVLAMLASYFVQHKGFEYHALPVQLFAVLAAVAALGALYLERAPASSADSRVGGEPRPRAASSKLASEPENRRSAGVPRSFPQLAPLVAAVAAAATLWTATADLLWGRDGRVYFLCDDAPSEVQSAPMTDLLDVLRPHVGKGDAVLWVAPSADQARYEVELDLRPVLRRTPMLVPGQYTPAQTTADPFPYHSEGELTKAERWVRDGMRDDLLRDRPPLIVIERGVFQQGFGWPTVFDFETWMRRDPEIDRVLTEDYAPVDVPAPLDCRFRLYSRR